MLPPLDLFMRHIPQPRNGEHLTPCSNLALGVNHHKTFKSIQYDLKLFFLKKIMITSEYLHNRLNLVLRSFQKRVEVLSVSVPDDLLEIRDPRHRAMCVPNIQPGSYYKTWKLNQRTQNKDAFQKIMLQHAFLPFSLILLLLTKLKKGKERQDSEKKPNSQMKTQAWHSLFLVTSIENPLLIPHRKDLLLRKSKNIIH